ncbi:hypothetical protein K501DRAFT_331310 [Backusella circina FSU 941]|nr:hypothetical protein K501DRAFT_331310 [Backusella circina FSU 941]
MSLLNFFKSEENKKTDCSITFNTVLSNLQNTSESNNLDIDTFIQSENIDLRQHQKNYQKKDTKEIAVNEVLTDLKDKKDITQEDGRRLVNTYIEFTETLPELQSNIDTSVQQLKEAQHTAKDTTKTIQESHLLE